MNSSQDLTLAQIAQLNAGQGHIHRPQTEVLAGSLPSEPTDEAGVELGVARIAIAGVTLREDPIRRSATVDRVVWNPTPDAVAIDVVGQTHTYTPPDTGLNPAEYQDDVLRGLADAVNGAQHQVIAVLHDDSGDGLYDRMELLGHFTRFDITASQGDTYSLFPRNDSFDYDASSSATGDDLIDDIATGLEAASSAVDYVDVRAIDTDQDGLNDVIYVGPEDPFPLDIDGASNGAGDLVKNASGDSSDVTLDYNASASGPNGLARVRADATSATFDVWGKQSWGIWDHINGLEGIQTDSNWTENLNSLASFDRGFIRITASDGRVTPYWAPALG